MNKAEYLKQWRQNHPGYKAPGADKSRAKYRNSSKGKAKELAYRKSYRDRQKELNKIRMADSEYVKKQREWHKNHAKKPEIQARKRELHKQWSKNPEYIIKRRLRARFAGALKLYGDGKLLSSRNYGISYKHCIFHLEKLAKSMGYTIKELKELKYQIDHIIPCALYNLNDKKDIANCWNPKNLRWLSGKENASKGNTLRPEDIKVIKTLPKEIYPKSWNGIIPKE
tara:strand:+ start:132 stop:809 length:678 start_codon:yes stop_codon:yes gene_type:complete